MIELLAIILLCIAALVVLGTIGGGINLAMEVIVAELEKLRSYHYHALVVFKKWLIILFCAVMLVLLIIAFFGSIYISGMGICRLVAQFFF